MALTEFGKWLGKHNGKTMLINGLRFSTKEQSRAVITTYCILFGIKTGTKEWDKLMDWMFDGYNSWFNDKEELSNYMGELL